MKNGNLIVGLDVGTTKTCVVVGEMYPVETVEGSFLPNSVHEIAIDIISVGSSPSAGIKRGVVVNIEKTAESIKRAVKEAEVMADVEIKAAYVSIAGDHISNSSSHGVIAVKEREISQREVDRVIDAAKTVAFPIDREILHVVPTGFVVDGQNGINNPRGMSGVRLEANVQIITASVTSMQNIIKSCYTAGLQVIDIILNPLASAAAILSQEEKDIGVGLVDIGGGKTDITLFYDGNMCYNAALNVGGNNFTNDIAIGLRIPASEAEKIKKEHGCALMSMVRNEEAIELTYTGDRPAKKLSRRNLIKVLEPRAEELLHLVKEELIKSGFRGFMTSGIVLTGGTALIQGIDIMAENILELPVRIGIPKCIDGVKNGVSNPAYSTGAGLVLYGAREALAEYKFSNANLFNGLRTRMRGLVNKIVNLRR